MIVFDDMIDDMLSNKKVNPIVAELFIRGRKLNISLVFITLSCFAVPKNIRLNLTHTDFVNLYKKCTAKPYYFSVIIDTTLTSGNSSRFRKNLPERISKLIITIDDKIRDERVQYHINRVAAKILALSSGKIDKYEILTGEEILPSDQSRIIKQANFTFSPLDEAFEKQMKTIED